MTTSEPAPLSDRALLPRLAAYLAVVAVAAWGYVRAVREALDAPDLEPARAFLAEGGVLEWLQVVLLALAFLVALSPVPRPRHLLDVLLALLLAVALVRELDDHLMRLLFRHVHRVLMVALLVSIAAIAFARRARLQASLPAFLGRPGFYLLLFAALIAGSLAQVLGSTEVWRTLSSDEAASRIAKRFVEEGLESISYLLIALGVFEERCFRAALRTAP